MFVFPKQVFCACLALSIQSISCRQHSVFLVSWLLKRNQKFISIKKKKCMYACLIFVVPDPYTWESCSGWCLSAFFYLSSTLLYIQSTVTGELWEWVERDGIKVGMESVCVLFKCKSRYCTFKMKPVNFYLKECLGWKKNSDSGDYDLLHICKIWGYQ